MEKVKKIVLVLYLPLMNLIIQWQRKIVSWLLVGVISVWGLIAYGKFGIPALLLVIIGFVLHAVLTTVVINWLERE